MERNKDNQGMLREQFMENPFTILDARTLQWQQRKKWWRDLGIADEEGRSAHVYSYECLQYNRSLFDGISKFDPHLCELMYRWFCPEGGTILDPFAGGSTRGIVAQYLGYHYTGIDIRSEQIASNRKQAQRILKGEQPQWIVGDSYLVLDGLKGEYDMVLSCPPYGNLEVYSEMRGDISNMAYPQFLRAYRAIIRRSCDLLKKGGFAVFVVGEFRDCHGNYVGFIPDTIRAFMDCGMDYYNEAILCMANGNAGVRATNNMKTRKLVKTHQNVLVFRK